MDFDNLPTRRELLRQAAGLPGYLVVASTCGVPAPAGAAASGEVRIACIGDSMIDGVWGGLLRLVSKEPCLKSRITLGRYGENGTGLTRPDHFNWTEESTKILGNFRPDLVIVSMGLNDRQGVVNVKTKARTEYGAPDWSARYQGAVAEFLHSASATSAGLLWLGIPTMRDKTAQVDAKEKNRIYADAIKSFGNEKVVFVDAWRQPGAIDDDFKVYGQDGDGAKIQIRALDGIHFTAAGYDIVAAYLLPKILAQLKSSNVEIAYPCDK